MKLLFSLLILFLGLLSLQAQENQEETYFQYEETGKRGTGNNELSINALDLIIFGALDITYERILTNNTSITAEVFLKFVDEDGDELDISEVYSKNYSVASTFKYFFSERKRAGGFYCMGFAQIATGEYDDFDDTFNSDTGQTEDEGLVDYTDLALGLGVGGKFVARKGFFADISFGIGRNLFNEDAPTIIANLDASVGFRF